MENTWKLLLLQSEFFALALPQLVGVVKLGA